jgi:molecular chaperone GrpE
VSDEKEQVVDESPAAGENETPVAEVEVENEVDSEAEIEAPSLEDQLEEAKAQAAEYLDGWQRARAELANFKKRTERERVQLKSTLRSDIIGDLLPMLDDFDLAFENLPEDIAVHDWVNGMLLIQRKLISQLNELGVSSIEAEPGMDFNPELHEAVTAESSDEFEPGQIVGVMRKGYLLDGRVIRAAMVRVAG